MQKISFNNHYGLQDAVFEGYKEMTRREPIEYDGDIVTEIRDGRMYVFTDTSTGFRELLHKSCYVRGEFVAVAEAYKDVYSEASWLRLEKGWNDKMFVKAVYMPHHIRITDIKVERLQDISDEDCIKEGVKEVRHPFVKEANNVYVCQGINGFYTHPKDCFADLIDKVSGKGTWNSNPYVIVYSFELVD